MPFESDDEYIWTAFRKIDYSVSIYIHISTLVAAFVWHLGVYPTSWDGWVTVTTVWKPAKLWTDSNGSNFCQTSEHLNMSMFMLRNSIWEHFRPATLLGHPYLVSLAEYIDYRSSHTDETFILYFHCFELDGMYRGTLEDYGCNETAQTVPNWVSTMNLISSKYC